MFVNSADLDEEMTSNTQFGFINLYAIYNSLGLIDEVEINKVIIKTEMLKHQWTGCVISRGTFTNILLTLIPAWISNHMPSKVWDETTYSLAINGVTTEVREWISNFIPHIRMDVITYPCWD